MKDVQKSLVSNREDGEMEGHKEAEMMSMPSGLLCTRDS